MNSSPDDWSERDLAAFADELGWSYMSACDEALLLLDNEAERRSVVAALDGSDGIRDAVLRGLLAERQALLAGIAEAPAGAPPSPTTDPRAEAVELRPTTLKRANDFVAAHHRHNGRTARNGGKFAVCAILPSSGTTVGVVIVGNPLSATYMDGLTAEVTRLCVAPFAPRNTCSRLYGAAARIWKEMGGRRILTYTLASECGASLRGSGWSAVAHCPPSGSRWQKKGGGSARQDQAIYWEPKTRWEKQVGGGTPSGLS